MHNLLLLMTPGIGLNDWKRTGTFSRELKPYEEYVRNGWRVKILSFDKGYIPELPDGIEAVPFPGRERLFFLPWTHKELGEWADVIKTNQSHHAYLYTRAAACWRKPILLRCGYVHGEFLERTKGRSIRTRVYQFLEKKAFKSADHVQVPTVEYKEWIIERYGIERDKITVVPNFVNTRYFQPLDNVEKKERSVISVGRLSGEKRYDLLLEACSSISDCEVTIIGEGPERKRLESIAEELDVKLELPGNIDNEKIPEFLNKNMVFTMSSQGEGHPKALIEAMSCGLPCVVVKVPGLENMVENKKTGLVVESNPAALKEGIETLLNDEESYKRISSNSREYVFKEYSFNKVFKMELDIVESLSI